MLNRRYSYDENNAPPKYFLFDTKLLSNHFTARCSTSTFLVNKAVDPRPYFT